MPGFADGHLAARVDRRVRWARRTGIACVSTATMEDVARLIRRRDGSRVATWLVLNGLNAPYRRLVVGSVEWREAEEIASRKVRQGGEGNKATGEGGGEKGGATFVLNVGSSLSRKNRDGAVRIFARVKDEWPEGKLVFAGEALTPEVRELARELGVAERVVEVVKPTDAELEALYNRATCLLFPSKFEGFGWPAVEAQACGCPVLCSDAGSLGEVGGGTPRSCGTGRDEAGFAGEVLRVAKDEGAQARWTELGFAERGEVRRGGDGGGDTGRFMRRWAGEKIQDSRFKIQGRLKMQDPRRRR